MSIKTVDGVEPGRYGVVRVLVPDDSDSARDFELEFVRVAPPGEADCWIQPNDAHRWSWEQVMELGPHQVVVVRPGLHPSLRSGLAPGETCECCGQVWSPPDAQEPDRDVHSYFELTYASYLTLPRVLLQGMPARWQHEFVGLLETFHAAYRHVDQPEGYHVEPGKWVYVEEADEDALRRLGWADSLTDWLKENPEPGPGEVDEDEYDAWSSAYDAAAEAKVWWDPAGNEAGPAAKAFFPTRDPLPHYRYPKGIKPRFDPVDEQLPAGPR